MTNRTAVFLCSKMSGYFFNCILRLKKEYLLDVLVYCYPSSDNAPFRFPSDEVQLHDRTKVSDRELLNVVMGENPIICYCAGWFDKGYLRVARALRVKSIPVIAGVDNHYLGTWRQLILRFFGKRILKRSFDYLWVPGTEQFHYALLLGFKPKQILKGLYTADKKNFRSKDFAPKNGPHKLIFVGRLLPYKAPVELAESFIRTMDLVDHDWELVIVGNGEEKNRIPKHNKIEVLPFMQPKELSGLIASASAFCLPSSKENWGVVVHEFATAGMVLVLSDGVGAANNLLVDQYNGFTFKSGDFSGLDKKLLKLFTLSDEELAEMRSRSKEMAEFNSPELWGARFMSVVKH